MIDVFLTDFIRCKVSGVDLKWPIQVANWDWVSHRTANSALRAEINLSINKLENYELIRSLFRGEETGYFKLGNSFYYRNCNAISNVEGGEAFYRGKLPNSFLWCQITMGREIDINIQVTKNYLWESRSRLTKNSAFEDLLNNLIIVASILTRKIPMHAAAITLDSAGTTAALFMGLPNTGKTTTSQAVCSQLNSIYLAEDICFVDAANSKIYPCATGTVPRTTNAVVGHIFCLRRQEGPSVLSAINEADEGVAFVNNMNLYEFSWDHDVVIRSLLGHVRHQAARHQESTNILSQFNVQSTYKSGIATICQRALAVDVCGESPVLWADMIFRFIKSSEHEAVTRDPRSLYRNQWPAQQDRRLSLSTIGDGQA